MIGRIIIGAAALSLVIALVLGCSSNSPSAPPVNTGPTLSVNDVAQNEDISPMKFVVTLSAASTSNVIFSYATQNVTAIAGADYVAVSGTDTIVAGDTKDTINVAIIDDDILEQADTFNLNLSNASGATIQDGLGVGTINLNDGATTGVSFINEVKPILEANCALTGCHVNATRAGGFTMQNASGIVASDTVRWAVGNNGRIVIFFQAAQSNLYLKTTDTPPFGSRMPANGPPYLDLTQQAKIRDWIAQGAPNN
ncbi:MAG: Calx-beta domain-containing protein [Candidatus Zixiibacteriota bacterium]